MYCTENALIDIELVDEECRPVKIDKTGKFFVASYFIALLVQLVALQA